MLGFYHWWQKGKDHGLMGGGPWSYVRKALLLRAEDLALKGGGPWPSG